MDRVAHRGQAETGVPYLLEIYRRETDRSNAGRIASMTAAVERNYTDLDTMKGKVFVIR